eukprot:scaffold17.g470.t1
MPSLPTIRETSALLLGLLLGITVQPLVTRLLGEASRGHSLGRISFRITQTSTNVSTPASCPSVTPAAYNCSSMDELGNSSALSVSRSLAFASFVYPAWPTRNRPAQPELPPPPPSTAIAIDPDVLWGYSPLLDPRALQRGVLQHGDPARLRRFVARLLQGKPAVVAAVGGSISVGRGAANQPGIDTSWPSYLDQFERWLRAAFPASRARLVNAAQGGTTSNMFDSCAESLVPADADLVVVEFALNDGTMAHCTVDDNGRTDQGSIPARAAYERLLRKLQRLPRRPAVVVMQSYSFIRGSTGAFHKSAENDMDVFASYYGLPVLSVRAAMYHLMAQNRPGYRVDLVRSDNKRRTQPTDLFFWDISHPYGPTGHRYMAELLIGLTQMTAGSLHLKPLQDEENTIAAEHIPPPMLAGNYQKKAASCLLSADFKNAASESRGFVHNDEKWGWVGSAPRAWVELSLDSRSSSDAVSLEQQQAEWQRQADNTSNSSDSSNSNSGTRTSLILLGHLASYTGMGQARVECLSGCACNASTLDGHWQKSASLQVMHAIQVTEHPKCRMRVTILDSSSSGGHKVKLTALVVLAGGTSELLSQPGRLEWATQAAAASSSKRQR